MAQRNRASGWKHAKLSGHTNEARVKELLDLNEEYEQEFLNRLGLSNEKIISTSIGGLHETNVEGILGKKTKSKTDLKIECENTIINISIKKSLAGQVYFVRAELFIEVFEKQFNKQIPHDVQAAIKLFWSSDDNAIKIIEQFADKNDIKSYELQLHHESLNATTLKAYDINLYNSMLKWFQENIYELTKLSFSMGGAKNKSEWSDYVWYINLLGENEIDEMFFIEDLSKAGAKLAEKETFYGDSNGGTTIQLPFGFVQWHQHQMQFHHNYEKICNFLIIFTILF